MTQQKISDLLPDDESRLSSQREWVLNHYEDTNLADSVEGKLNLINTILERNYIESNETVKLQSLGVVLGDAFSQEMKMEWKIIEDEYGRDPALIVRNTSIQVFPITMISKRVEDGEDVDVVDIFAQVCGYVKSAMRDAEIT